jgi:hypothetical protein
LPGIAAIRQLDQFVVLVLLDALLLDGDLL